MRSWQADAFAVADLPHVSWIIPGLITGSGWSLIIAPAKTGKSILCLQMMECLTRLKPFLFWSVERPWRVTFVEWDAPDGDFQAQVREISSYYGGPGEWSERAHVILPTSDDNSRLLDNPAECMKVYQALHVDHQADFIIYDALETLTVLDINKHVGAQEAVRRLKYLSQSKPFILIHHPRKSRTDESGHWIHEDPRNAAAGHHYLTANASTTMSLVAGTEQGELTVIGRRGASGRPFPLARLVVHPDVAVWIKATKAPPGVVQTPDGETYKNLVD